MDAFETNRMVISARGNSTADCYRLDSEAKYEALDETRRRYEKSVTALKEAGGGIAWGIVNGKWTVIFEGIFDPKMHAEHLKTAAQSFNPDSDTHRRDLLANLYEQLTGEPLPVKAPPKRVDYWQILMNS